MKSALCGLDETEEELYEGGFACACFADEGDVLTFVYLQIYIL